jgi:elongation factor Ts
MAMAEVTASLVNELRQRTAVGIMDCKKALVECGGDMEAAIDLLRKSGLAKAAKKAGREANEGLIRIHKANARHGAMLVLNCETDFVARNDKFQELANGLVQYFAGVELPPQCIGAAAPPEHISMLLGMHYADSQTVGEVIAGLIAVTGENMQLGQVVVERSAEPGDYLQEYMHGNRVGVLVCLTSGKPETHHNPRFIEAAKDVAMQVAAAMPVAPRAVDRDGVDPADVEHEKNILIDQAKAEGKPQEIAEKMVAGRLSKFFAEVCLLEQPFIKDEKLTVKAMLEGVAQEIGDTIHVARFHRFQLGS